MANTTTTPNMNLVVPVASTDPGPDWAQQVVTDFYAVDSHNHTSGQGVQIPPSGLNINADLTFGNNNATGLKSSRYTAQAAPLSGGSDLGCVYVSGKDLYYNDEDGNQVRITASGSVSGSTGTITGLPSGTASASFSAATFTFQSATNTGATVSCGPVAIGSTTASGKKTTIASAGAQSANIALVLPTAAPANNSVMTSDNSGNMAWATTLTGQTFNASTLNSPTLNLPSFSSNPSGTVVGGTYSPTIVDSNGTTVAAGSWFYHRVGSIVIVKGAFTSTPSANASVFTATLPLLPTSSFAAVTDLTGTLCSFNSSVQTTAQESALVQATVSAKTAAVQMWVAGASVARNGSISFAYSCA